MFLSTGLTDCRLSRDMDGKRSSARVQLNGGRRGCHARVHPRDEQEYAGIVRFYDNMSAIADAFRSFDKPELVKRRRGAGGSSSPPWELPAREASSLFRRRFAPEAVFRRAKVFEDLESWHDTQVVPGKKA